MKKAPPTLLPSLLYLLNITVPHAPTSILNSKLSTLLSLLQRPLANPHLSAAQAAAAGAAAAAATAAATASSEKGKKPQNPAGGGAAVAEGLAAQLRSALSMYQSLLSSLPANIARKDLGMQQCFNSVLPLCIDVRPKVRRRAQEVVLSLLEVGEEREKVHPFAKQALEWIVQSIGNISEAPHQPQQQKQKPKQQKKEPAKYDKKLGKAHNSDAAAALRQSAAAIVSQSGVGKGTTQAINPSAGIWVCNFAKESLPLFCKAGLLGSSSADAAGGDSAKKGGAGGPVDKLVSALLRLPALQNPFLTVAALDCFHALFKASSPSSSDTSAASASAEEPASAPLLISTLRALRAPKLKNAAMADAQLLPAYLRALSSALVALSRRQVNNASGDESLWASSPATQGGKKQEDAASAMPNAMQIIREVMEKCLAMEMGRKSKDARNAAKNLIIDLVRYALPTSKVVEASSAQSGRGAVVKELVKLLEDALGKNALKYTHARAEILEIVVAVISKLRIRATSTQSPSKGVADKLSPTAAETLCLPIIRAVASLRVEEGFEYRESADAVLGMAVEVCGPRFIVNHLSLGLLGENDDTVGRAWLLPLMRGRITNTELAHFLEYMVPLSEKLFERRVQAEEALNGNNAGQPSKKYSVEAKMYEALTEQVWALFPGYCDLPVDLSQAFNQKLAELLANVLYSQPALRPPVFRGLQLLVERNTSLANSSAPDEDMQTSFGLTPGDGKANLKHLASMAENLLAVFFNVFAQSPADSRGYITEAITVYCEVLSKKQVEQTYIKILGMLNNALPQLPTTGRSEPPNPAAPPPPAHTMIDLLVLLVPHLAAEQSTQLFDLALGESLLGNKDAGVQKKTYRLLTRLVDGKMASTVLASKAPAHGTRLGLLLHQIGESTEAVVAGAKRDRIALLAALVPKIPPTELHFLPSIIPEAVLGTKEANQAARQSSYDLLVQMGEKMKAGGQVKAHLINGDVDEDMEDAAPANIKDASLQEYVTMVAAGLAGATPHMISATITSISRLLYEYKNELSRDTLDEIASTVEVFLRSANREIVKSALGCVKVVIIGLEHELLNKHVKELVSALLGFTPANKQHFKSKVRHIFERLIRRFGFERIDSLTDEGNKKLIQNIRKRKERARRKKAGRDDDDGEDDEEEAAAAAGRRKTKDVGVDAFEDALHDSESDVSGSEDEDEGDAAAQQKNGKAGRKIRKEKREQEHTYIMEDDDQPMDLLDRSASAGHILTRTVQNGKPGGKDAKSKRRPGQDDLGFATDAETGKLLLRDDEEGNEGGEGDMDVDDAGAAFTAKGRGVDGYSVTKTGAVKFNKNTKRVRQEEAELDELLAAAAEEGGKKKYKSAKKQKTQIGSEFKASRAKGDVQKKGAKVSPYAYGELLPEFASRRESLLITIRSTVPLSQVSGKKSKDAKGMDITGKGKRRS